MLSTTVYGLPEKQQDKRIFMAGLSAISVSSVPNAGQRLGIWPRDSTTSWPRPLKVTFSSISDRDAVLNAAPELKGHSNYGAVCISKFLLLDEIAKMKQLHIQCKERDDAAAASGDTSKPYIVTPNSWCRMLAAHSLGWRQMRAGKEHSHQKTARAEAMWLPIIWQPEQQCISSTYQSCVQQSITSGWGSWDEKEIVFNS